MMLRGTRTATAIAALLFLSSAILFQGCNHQNSGSTKFATHTVTMKRHGITHRFGVEERDPQLAIFHYDGYNMSGDRLKLRIENDKVLVNDKMVGTLNKGDSVRITDDGFTVNALDHGQTEKYLQASLKQETAQAK